MDRSFDLQGHRGARGLKPENTLPAFEVALDLMVSTLETDLHLTKDDVPICCHDEAISEKLTRVVGKENVPPPANKPRVRSLTLEQLRNYAADRNPEPARFPKQNNEPTPVAEAFAAEKGIPVYALPTLAELFAFVKAYAGELGAKAGKSETQRAHARHARFDLELKRTPFRPEHIGDAFDGGEVAELERQVVHAVRKAGVADRTTVQSFDHRSVLAVRKMEPKITGAVLIAGTAPVSLVSLVEQASAKIYAPDFQFLDVRQVRQAHEAKIKIVPWTVNDLEDMQRLLDWGVNGVITDYPDRLIPLLQARHWQF